MHSTAVRPKREQPNERSDVHDAVTPTNVNNTAAHAHRDHISQGILRPQMHSMAGQIEGAILIVLIRDERTKGHQHKMKPTYQVSNYRHCYYTLLNRCLRI